MKADVIAERIHMVAGDGQRRRVARERTAVSQRRRTSTTSPSGALRLRPAVQQHDEPVFGLPFGRGHMFAGGVSAPVERSSADALAG
jgi:hypothetical protein